MELSISQIALMSRLLDEALPLDAAGRRLWLENLPAEYQHIAAALRRALQPTEELTAGSVVITRPPAPDVAAAEIAAAASALQPSMRVGPYELVRPLGSGGMAEVWLARRADGAFKRDVALKLPTLRHPRAELEQRFACERDILAALEHPHIARLYDAGVSPEGLPYLAMEYVRGEMLTAWCDKHRLGVRERLPLVLQVLDAVQYAHAQHVIHRDIKPSNILVNAARQVQLLDFGVAKLLAQDDSLTVLFGRAMTPQYASPELARGDPVEPTSDVYSLGILIYELLTGSLPYAIQARGSAAAVERAITAAEVLKPSAHLATDAGAARGVTQDKLARQLRGDLDAIVMKALSKAPSGRYGSVAALAEDLRRYLSGRAVEARAGRFTYRLGKLLQRHPAEWAAAAAAVLAAAALTYALTRPPHSVTVAAPTTSLAVPGTTAQPEAAKSIAVLPFVDLSERKDQEYFSDGLSEELINHLVHSPDLRVVARTSSFQFKGKNEDARSIARTLGVTNLLEGSVRKAGQQLRITAQLIRASDGVQLWSQSYDRSLDDIFKLQDEIGQNVAEALHVALGSSRPRGNSEPDVRAYNLVLQGNYYRERRNLPDSEKAIQLYRQAIDISPGYALAWARLASAYLSVALMKGLPSEADNTRVLDALDQAIRLDPGLAWAYYTRGGFEMSVRWNWAAALADTERARELDPRFNFLPIAFGSLAFAFGETDRALKLYEQQIARNPLDPSMLEGYSSVLCATNRLNECLRIRLRVLQLHPEFHGVNSSVGIAYLQLGDLAAALDAMQREPDADDKLRGLAMIYAAMGRRSESDVALRSLTERTEASDAYGIAVVHAFRGEIDDAFYWLDRAYLQHNEGMVDLKVEPLLRNLHSDPRFQALLTRMKLTDPIQLQHSHGQTRKMSIVSGVST